MTYRAPVDDHLFLMKEVIGGRNLPKSGAVEEFGGDEAAEILAGAGRLANEILEPLQRLGDANPSQLSNGVVVTPPGYAEGYRAIADGGWVGMCASPEFGGSGLPLALANAVNEMLNGSCMALGLNPLLTQAQIRALEKHASDEIKRIYLPKLASGTWSGTMNITEPQAGSDVGMLRCLAEPLTDGSYSLTGQKIYISWADADFAENICHLVLARLPSSPAGTKGLSLFLVPKLVPQDDGQPGQRNRVRILSLEEKLGIHGSPTAVVEHDGAKGWMIGAPNGGMAAMFTMMNYARLGVGCQGVGVAEAALQQAAGYSRDRKQGRPSKGIDTICGHANVRRMLALMQSQVFAARAICAACAQAIDCADSSGEEGWARRAALLTPIAKGFGSDTGVEVSLAGIAIQGGSGYIEGSGAPQFFRDSLVTTIYEGTNGIQAIDLVSRKLDAGEAIRLLDEIALEFEEADGQSAALSSAGKLASIAVREATEWMTGQADMMKGRLAPAPTSERSHCSWALHSTFVHILLSAERA